MFLTGREIIAAVKKASTWREAVTVGEGDGLLITREALGAKAPEFVADDSLGLSDPVSLMKAKEKVEGSIEGYLRYEGLDLLFALALGSSSDPQQIDSSSAYSHLYQASDSIKGLFATLVIKKSQTPKGVWEIPSAKITGFTISGEVGELAKVSFDLLGNKIETENPVNSDSSLSAVTYKGKGLVCQVNEKARVRMNKTEDEALDDDDRIFPSSFEITFKRPFRENYELGYTDMSEPVQDDFTEATIRLTFDKYNIDTFMSAIESQEAYKMDFLFEGPLIPGTSVKYQLKIEIPKVVWTSGSADVDSPGLISHVAEGRMIKPESAPSGMETSSVIGVQIVNTLSTNPLSG